MNFFFRFSTITCIAHHNVEENCWYARRTHVTAHRILLFKFHTKTTKEDKTRQITIYNKTKLSTLDKHLNIPRIDESA